MAGAARLTSGPGLFASAIGDALGAIPAGLAAGESRVPDIIGKTQQTAYNEQMQPLRLGIGQEELAGLAQQRAQSAARFPWTLRHLAAEVPHHERMYPLQEAGAAATTAHVQQQTASGAQTADQARTLFGQQQQQHGRIQDWLGQFDTRLNGVMGDPGIPDKAKAALFTSLVLAPPTPDARTKIVDEWTKQFMHAPPKEPASLQSLYAKAYDTTMPAEERARALQQAQAVEAAETRIAGTKAGTAANINEGVKQRGEERKMETHLATMELALDQMQNTLPALAVKGFLPRPASNPIMQAKELARAKLKQAASGSFDPDWQRWITNQGALIGLDRSVYNDIGRGGQMMYSAVKNFSESPPTADAASAAFAQWRQAIAAHRQGALTGKPITDRSPFGATPGPGPGVPLPGLPKMPPGAIALPGGGYAIPRP